jgi:hypothetical protein
VTRTYTLPCLVTILGAALSMMASAAAAAGNASYDVFVIAVGSEHYLESNDPALRGYPRANGAVRSAGRVARILAGRGARYAELVASRRDRPVGVADVERALDRTTGAIAAAAAKRPLLLVYLASHGISEGFGWSYFGVPGNLVIRPETGRLPDVSVLAEKTWFAAELVHRLNALGVPYILLLDTCYEGEDRLPVPAVLSETATGNVEDVAAILRHLNSFRQPDPVLFAAAPGEVVRTPPDPEAPEVAALAPLARRLTLLDRVSRGREVTLNDLVTGLMDAALDPLTAPAVTEAEYDAVRWTGIVLWADTVSEAAVRRVEGTATAADICCAEDAQLTADAVYSGELAIDGEQGDWITDGRSFSLKSAATAPTLGRSDLSVVFEAPDGESWTIELVMPGGRPFAPGTYADAERAWFHADDRPGLAVTGAGRACNEVEGEMTILTADRDSDGRLRRLEALFTQWCDGSSNALTGRLRLVRKH